MRHDQLIGGKDFDLVDVAAIWPRGDTSLQPPLDALVGTRSGATPAVPDMPPAIGRMIVGVYAGIIGAFALTMGRGGEAAFVIAISALYVAMFLGVPRIFLRIENDQSPRPDLDQFLRDGIHTSTGHMSGRSALVQIMLVPAMLLLAISTMGAIALWVLP
jgi:hypothetical protein